MTAMTANRLPIRNNSRWTWSRRDRIDRMAGDPSPVASALPEMRTVDPRRISGRVEARRRHPTHRSVPAMSRSHYPLRIDLPGPSVALIATLEGGIQVVIVGQRDGNGWSETQRLAEWLNGDRVVADFLRTALYVVGRVG